MNDGETASREMIGIAEYAKRHGVPRNTVAYWCQKGMLKGVVKQPDPQNRNAKYIYLIPADAKPQKQTLESIAAKQGMITAKEYAQRIGCCKKTVVYWCWCGKIPGAVKAKNESGADFWMIPEGARVTKPYKPQKARQKKATEAPAMEPKPKRKLTEREISLHIRRFCGTHAYSSWRRNWG